jgi:hypothetical protein
MWRVYEVEPYLEKVTADIRDTLLNHCKSEKRIRRSYKQTVFWFKVSQKKGEDGPAVKAEGVLGKCKFIFRSDGRRARFSSDQYYDPENTFFQFAYMINFYRRDLGLEPMDIDGFYDIVGEDSPPVGKDNYALFDSIDTRALQDILKKKFIGVAYQEVSGKYSVIIYSENAGVMKHFSEKNIPVCQKFLGDFQNMYGYKDAMLVCVRNVKEQHVYFYAAEKGIFYNTEDTSRGFLEQGSEGLTRILAISQTNKQQGISNRGRVV